MNLLPLFQYIFSFVLVCIFIRAIKMPQLTKQLAFVLAFLTLTLNVTEEYYEQASDLQEQLDLMNEEATSYHKEINKEIKDY